MISGRVAKHFGLRSELFSALITSDSSQGTKDKKTSVEIAELFCYSDFTWSQFWRIYLKVLKLLCLPLNLLISRNFCQKCEKKFHSFHTVNSTLLKLRKFSLALFMQKFRESKFLLKTVLLSWFHEFFLQWEKMSRFSTVWTEYIVFKNISWKCHTTTYIHCISILNVLISRKLRKNKWLDTVWKRTIKRNHI